ncbi:MAG: protein disulfide-isomerase [Flammeovirgaceae bacterium]|jgi:protein disulfide-isomerase
MKKTSLLLLAFGVLFSFSANAQTWETNYAEAVAKAKKENKKLLLNFTGSDWCGWCHKLDGEVFSKEDFKEYAQKNLVLVKLDFPRRTQISEAEKVQNNALATKHGVRGFPTILLMDANEELLLTTGYQAGGPSSYIQHLNNAIPNKNSSGDSGAVEWETNYEEAVAKAKRENKQLLLNFTGSDWCGWCIKLDREVFSKEEFLAYAKDNLVLVKLDFPSKKVIPAAEKKQNYGLQSKYDIKGYPSILLLKPSEEIILRTGYQNGGPANYVNHLEKAISKS